MGLEAASFLNDLNTANPAGTDAKSQGDDHLRLIKTVLKATFPGMTAAYLFDVTTTADLFQVLSTNAGAQGPILDFYHNSASAANDDIAGQINFQAKDDAGNKTIFGQIVATAFDIANGSEDGRLTFKLMAGGSLVDKIIFRDGGFTIAPRVADEVASIHTAADDELLVLNGGNTINLGGQLFLYGPTHATNAGDVAICQDNDFKYSWDASEAEHEFYDPVLFTVSGGSAIFVTQNTTANPGLGNNTQGSILHSLGSFFGNANTTWHGLGRAQDGQIVGLNAAGAQQGAISISGSTTTYAAFTGSHWSQLVDGSKPTLLRGTIVQSVNQMCQWKDLDGDPYNDERLPCFKISDALASKEVYGVFGWWDEDVHPDSVEGIEDAYIVALGAYFIRLHPSQNPEIGDYIESNGDGTGRIQSDDILRSSTVAKITSKEVIETFPDGSKLYCCTLHCG